MDSLEIRDLLRKRRQVHQEILQQEVTRLKAVAATLGVQRMILFGSVARGNPGLTSDLDLLVVWDTSLDYLARTVELYRRLAPQVAVDLLVYTPDEMKRMIHTPFVRKVLTEGSVLYEA